MANSGELRRVEFGPSDLRRVRELVQAIASERLPDRVDDAVLAVHEVAVNSIVHGGGRAILSIHETPDSIVFTVDDEDGTGTVPLVGRISEEATSGRGLQIADPAQRPPDHRSRPVPDPSQCAHEPNPLTLVS